MTSGGEQVEPRTFRQTPAGGLVAAMERLAAARDIDEVVAVVRATARRLIGSDGIAVILRDGDQCRYVEEDAMGPLWKGETFPMAACISGWAMIHRQTVTIEEVAQDPRIPYQLYRNTFVRSLAMAPVRVHDPVGAIGAYWSQAYLPSPEEVEILETLARATATAIENVRLVQALSNALSEAELARDELRHRVKNAFSAAQALAGLSLSPQQARPLAYRIAALSRAHELLDRRLSRDASITLAELVEAELEPYQTETPGRLRFEGGRLVLPGAQAVALGLALNELATNALKYGALSVPDGRLEVRWRAEGGHVVLEWEEADGPEVRAATLESFGSRLLRRLVEGQLRGSLRRELARSGVTCLIEFPAAVEAGVTAA